MPDLVTSAGRLIVVDDESRLRWRPAGSISAYAGLWPSPDERRELIARMRAGAGLLVVAPLRNPDVAVFRDRSGSLFTAPDLSGVRDDDELAEIAVPVLDWLPAALRLIGQHHRRALSAEILRRPALLRPPFVIRNGSRGVKFALRTASTAAATPGALAELADFVFSADRRERRRPREHVDAR